MKFQENWFAFVVFLWQLEWFCFSASCSCDVRSIRWSLFNPSRKDAAKLWWIVGGSSSTSEPRKWWRGHDWPERVTWKGYQNSPTRAMRAVVGFDGWKKKCFVSHWLWMQHTGYRFFTFTHHRICELWLHLWHPHDDPSLTHISLRRVVQPPVNSLGFWYPIDMDYIQVFGKLYLIPLWKSWFILVYYSKTRPNHHQVRRKALGPNISLVGLHSSNLTIAWKITTCQRQS